MQNIFFLHMVNLISIDLISLSYADETEQIMYF